METNYVSLKATFAEESRLAKGLTGKSFTCDFEIGLKTDCPVAKIIIEDVEVEGLEEFGEMFNNKKALIREMLGAYSRDCKLVYKDIQLDQDLELMLTKWLARDQFKKVKDGKVYRHIIEKGEIADFVAATNEWAYYKTHFDYDVLIRIADGEVVCNNAMIESAIEEDGPDLIIFDKDFDEPDYLQSQKNPKKED